ncbi:(-)-germacrene D synthase-like isoform X3 [Vigna radiata var. radiata]|uniref:(-)-germacrene D synthase-like isoform X3 n=1 Tax=Vigna radiata var. radiata TaxID=3916 RepID=A0A1S3TCC8_VIGRR|nr:(-)-germacrene D synthase-like isoform X3 [Vigna radiata var. radiata]
MSSGSLSPLISASGAKPPFTRPTANFHPSIWGDRFLSYVPSSAESDSRIQEANLLKEDVRKRLVSPIDDNNFSLKLSFIDSVQRLGVSYHFEHEIDNALCQMYDISTKDNNIIAHSDDLYHTALLFRLLRQHGYRISSTLGTIVDDIYDAYGTIEELELFTKAIDRWDIRCLVDLPEYMQLCYKAIFDVYEEIDQEMRKQGKVYCIKYLKKEMKKLVQAQMVEARWCHSNHVPTVEEYMQVRATSSGYPMLITSSFLGMEDTTEEILLWATNEPVIIAASIVLLRIMDDIVGDEFEQDRQHVVSSIQCYMKEHKISRKCAIEELRKLVENAWKDINDACLAPTQVPMKFLMRAVNFARAIDVLYKDEDIFTNAGGIMKDHIEALLVKKMYV